MNSKKRNSRKTPAAKYKAYAKLLAKKGQSKTVRIKVTVQTGLYIYCTDRKNMIQECKNPIAKRFLMDFCM